MNGQPGQQSQQPQGQRPKQSNQNRNFQKNGGGNGQGGARRKNKPRRQQVFVGPMDHSYRTANGNVADSPPSTIEYRSGNGHPNGFHPVEPAVEAPPAPVREDAPTRIFCFIDDLFFMAKIQETARKLGVKVAFVKADKDIVSKLANVPEEARPSLIVFDLNNANAKPLTLVPRIKSKLKRGTSVIGFLSHLQGDLKVKALEAGCDMVMPRSAFSQNLPNLLRRHGLDEELEAMEA
jgi:CheY-like chemotaxis protein